jgi:hypothetical protein
MFLLHLNTTSRIESGDRSNCLVAMPKTNLELSPICEKEKTGACMARSSIILNKKRRNKAVISVNVKGEPNLSRTLAEEV